VWVDGSMIVRETRMIKDAYEIGRIQEAARIVDLALEHAIAHVREGMSEFALMSLIETTLRQHGHLGLMRMRGYNQEIITGMVGSGAAAAEPTYFDGPAGGRGLSPASPQSSSRKRIELNEPILIDIGCCIDGYVIDQTRTVVVGGLDDRLTFAYHIAEHILRSTEALLRPGTFCDDLYLRALEQAAEAGLSEFFMGYGADQVKFLGHGIGLEIDELPVLAKGFKLPLEAGMVIAIEPKFTFPGRGVVGIENSYLITSEGFIKLTCSREGILSIDA
jgi:Xaa-Pro dipeptidase